MDSYIIRAKARQILSGKWGLCVGVAAVASLLGALLAGFSFLPQIEVSIPVLTELTQKLERGLEFGNVTFSFENGALGLAGFLLGGVVQLGYAKFLLAQHDGQAAEFNDLFSRFDRFGQGFAQAFLRSLFTFLWSLCFIIPGIIARLRYAMTPFIMIEHPELTASEAIERSKTIMNGHKFELFILDISFIGWDLLCILSLNLGNLLLNPYKNAAYAVFYRQITSQQPA